MISDSDMGRGWHNRENGNAIAIGDIRITASKCCGCWSVVKAWRVDAAKLIDTINEGKSCE
jgi:hypothetical protein